MEGLIVFDSFFGNTEQIARSMGQALDLPDDRVCRASEAQPGQWDGLDLLIVGSPTRGFMPSPDTKDFLKCIPRNTLKGIKMAAFDTRLDLKEIKSSVFRFIVNTGGYAASSIAKKLTKKGGELVASPEGFLVLGEKGPVKAGELERAADWARQVIKG